MADRSANPDAFVDVEVGDLIIEIAMGWALLPVNTSENGTTTYGSYQLSNAWPGRLSAEQTVYLGQFTGRTLARSDTASFGTIGQVTELGVLAHLGTQFGVIDRVTMTTGVLLLLTSIGTSFAMWWIRRPSGGRAVLPKRPMNPKLPLAMIVIGLVVAVIYPCGGSRRSSSSHWTAS